MDENRYRKNILLGEIGINGQKKLLSSSVLILGIGGVGCPCAMYLAGIGIGKLGICDGDTIELHNLHRQVIYKTEDIGAFKADKAFDFLNGLNPDISIEVYKRFADADFIREKAQEYDVIIDAVDGFDNKKMIEEAVSIFRTPVVHVGIGGFIAQIGVSKYPHEKFGKLLNEYSEDNSLPSFRGTFAPTCGVAGSIAAGEAVKLILGIDTDASDRILQFDLSDNYFSNITI